ncbi:MAG: serine protease [Ferruginibacter sp.]
MKSTILFILLIPCFGQAQQSSYDYVSRYSYFLQLYCGDEMLVATGFIMNKNKKNYLVSNYHILAGKDAITGEMTDSIKRRPDSVGIGIHKSNFVIFKKYALYKNSKPIYKTIEDGKIDIAILPIDITGDTASGIFSFNRLDLDTSVSHNNGDSILVIGHSEECYLETQGTVPCTYPAIVQPCQEQSGDFGCMCYRVSIKKGASGSPVLQFDRQTNKVKLIGIHSRGSGYYKRGSAVLAKYINILLKAF